MDDIQLYQGLDWLERRHIVGKVQGYVFSPMRDPAMTIIAHVYPRFLPYIGYVTIAMVRFDSFPPVKSLLTIVLPFFFAAE